MPQMAPLMWTSLFYFFSFLILLITTKISFTFLTPQTNNIKLKKNISELNKMTWKW